MFFLVFWTAYIPAALIILSLVGESLKQSFREFRAHAWVANSERPRERGTAIASTKEKSRRTSCTAAHEHVLPFGGERRRTVERCASPGPNDRSALLPSRCGKGTVAEIHGLFGPRVCFGQGIPVVGATARNGLPHCGCGDARHE